MYLGSGIQGVFIWGRTGFQEGRGISWVSTYRTVEGFAFRVMGSPSTPLSKAQLGISRTDSG